MIIQYKDTQTTKKMLKNLTANTEFFFLLQTPKSQNLKTNYKTKFKK
jgi:hypothetical protein